MTDLNLPTPGSSIDNDSRYQEVGTFTVDEATRTVKGLLLPWNEESRISGSGNDPITFEPGTVRLPADFSALNANRHHNRFDPVARFTSVTSTDAGIVAEFEIARTPEGDELLAEAKPGGTLRKLSAELRDIVRDGAKGISAVLTGAAFVTEGAFASAGLFSIEPASEEDEPLTREEQLARLIATTQAAVTHANEALRTAVSGISELHAETETPETTEDDESPASTETPTTEQKVEDAQMANAVVPTSLATETSASTELSANAVFSLMTKAGNGDETALLALSDIKHSGTGALPAAGVLQPNWLGELWNGRAYTRKYLPLVRNGVIRATEEKGFKVTGADNLVQRWAGNKAELPTGTASTLVSSSTLYKYGYAADIAREFIDLPGGEEVLAAYYRAVINSYARITDTDALAEIVALATANTLAPEVYPTDYPEAMGMLIQGIEAVESAGDTPSFAIANEAAWKELLYTPRDQVPEFVSFAFGTNFEGSADRGIRVVKGDIGIDNTAAVVVGSANAIHFNEVAGAAPIQIEALDVARGGIDRAAVGYLQFLADFPDALVLVGEADV